MEKDTFDQVKRQGERGNYQERIEISSTGYGYELHPNSERKHRSNKKDA